MVDQLDYSSDKKRNCVSPVDTSRRSITFLMTSRL